MKKETDEIVDFEFVIQTLMQKSYQSSFEEAMFVLGGLFLRIFLITFATC
ncbi:hypothetical protein HOO54_21110 [Bacillus sp. WMMC1349]|nr:hypothetical protein [Bacillus sp. WMMC1349]NPC94657.1 hypothetical protein [Bacillus sp. WMMC1349]